MKSEFSDEDNLTGGVLLDDDAFDEDPFAQDKRNERVVKQLNVHEEYLTESDSVSLEKTLQKLSKYRPQETLKPVFVRKSREKTSRST